MAPRCFGYPSISCQALKDRGVPRFLGARAGPNYPDPKTLEVAHITREDGYRDRPWTNLKSFLKKRSDGREMRFRHDEID